MSNIHENCLSKIREEYSDKDTEYIRFDLHNIKEVGSTENTRKSGQHVWVKNKNKKREFKTFIAHHFCPWCGEKY